MNKPHNILHPNEPTIPTNYEQCQVICETYYTPTNQQDRCVGTKRVKATQTHVNKHACQDKPPNIMTVNAIISET